MLGSFSSVLSLVDLVLITLLLLLLLPYYLGAEVGRVGYLL